MLRFGIGCLTHQPLEQQRVDVVRGSAHLIPEPVMCDEIITPADLLKQGTHLVDPLVQLRLAGAFAAPRRADQVGVGKRIALLVLQDWLLGPIGVRRFDQRGRRADAAE